MPGDCADLGTATDCSVCYLNGCDCKSVMENMVETHTCINQSLE